MNSTVSNVLKAVLVLAVVGLSYYLYEIIQQPIRFEKIKTERYTKIKDRLEQIRDVQKVYRSEYLIFAKDFNSLISFVDTGKESIIERKDSSFKYYNDVFQQEMEKDTTIIRVLGYRSVKESMFGADFDASQLRYIPGTDNKEFTMDAGKIEVNDLRIPVFEAVAPNTTVFEDVMDDYDQFIDKNYGLKVGSMIEAKLSGNWK